MTVRMENSIRTLNETTPVPTEMVFGLDTRSSAGSRGKVSQSFTSAKRSFDIVVALAAMPVVLLVCLILVLVNPFWNPGPLFFQQKRMGRGCDGFTALKFRTMRPSEQIARGPDDPLEHERITPLGRFLRVTRIDELPQFVNVLNGDMSLIGPRPDYWNHAIHYVESIPGYRERHRVRPGITGLAQVDAGYAEGVTATIRKTHHDLRYIRRSGLRMEAYVLWRTLYVVLTGFGAR